MISLRSNTILSFFLYLGDKYVNAVTFIDTAISREWLLTAPNIEVYAVMKNRTVMSWMTVCRLVAGCQLSWETLFLYIPGRACCQCSSPKCWMCTYQSSRCHNPEAQTRLVTPVKPCALRRATSCSNYDRIALWVYCNLENFLSVFFSSCSDVLKLYFSGEFKVLSIKLELITFLLSGPGSSVGIATDCGLDGSGSNPGGDEIFRPSRPALGPTQPSVKWVPGLSRE